MPLTEPHLEARAPHAVPRQRDLGDAADCADSLRVLEFPGTDLELGFAAVDGLQFDHQRAVIEQ